MAIRIQKLIAAFSVLLFLGKMLAWYLTDSVAILTDALESVVNMITGFLGLYSVLLSAKPRDKNHPFGHGKIEYISAAVEGSLIFIAGAVIIYHAVYKLFYPVTIQRLDIGIVLIAITGVVNFFLGRYAMKQGVLYRSATVESAGKHILSDAYSTFALIIGLIALKLTGWQWLDSMVAIAFAVFIITTGYSVIKKSMAGIMDEADEELVDQIVKFLQQYRRPQWIDVHNLRVIRYGNVMHIDAHITLPWYYTVQEGENEIHDVEDLIKNHFGNTVEIFIHIDACVPSSCKICSIENCPVRESPFQQLLLWNIENVWADTKHGKYPDSQKA